MAASVSEQRNLFVEAEKALLSKDYSKYYRLAADLTDYALFPYLQYTQLKKQLDASNQIRAYLKANDATPYARFLRSKWLTHLAEANRWNEFLQHYRDNGETSLRCYYHWALYRSGDTAEAFKGAEALWLVGRSQPKACDALFAAWRKSPAFGPEMVWRRFVLALQNNQIRLAEYLKRDIASKDIGAAESMLKIHRKPEGILDCPDWAKAGARAGLVFSHGIDRLASTDPIAASIAWDKGHARFAIDPEVAGAVRKRLALALAFRRLGEAYHRMEAIADDDETVREWRVRAALQQRNWTHVLTALNRLTEEERAMPRWLYWRGRALENLGNNDDARGNYEQAAADRGFYGFLAADKVHGRYNLENKPLPIAASAVDRLAALAPFRAAREFLFLHREQDAKREWWHAVERLDHDDVLVAAKLAQRWGWDHIAIFTIARAEYWDDLDIRFPLSYQQQIRHFAQRAGLDPALVYGIVRQESAFDDHAYSGAGARGLMQILPGTARTVANGLREKWKSAYSLYDPDVNLRYGTTYFKTLLERFGGHIALAAGAYNAGPHRVEHWRTAALPVDADIWVETIPFKETRRYVASVLAYAIIYRHRMGQERRPITDFMSPVPPSAASTGTRQSDRLPRSCG